VPFGPGTSRGVGANETRATVEIDFPCESHGRLAISENGSAFLGGTTKARHLRTTSGERQIVFGEGVETATVTFDNTVATGWFDSASSVYCNFHRR